LVRNSIRKWQLQLRLIPCGLDNHIRSPMLQTAITVQTEIWETGFIERLLAFSLRHYQLRQIQTYELERNWNHTAKGRKRI
jgi:hypothetical protein